MSEPLCAVESCGRPVKDATVCQSCSDRLAAALGDVPALADEIEVTVTRQSRMADRKDGPRSATRPLVFDMDASIMRDALRNTLSTWIREITYDGETLPSDTIGGMARWLLVPRRLERIRHHPAAGEAVDEITACVRTAEHNVMGPSLRWYAGPCDCGLDLYVVPSAALVRCRSCGTEYDVAARRDWLLETAEDTLAHAALIAQALTVLESPVKVDRIYKWAERGRIADRGVDPRGRPLYRVGDVRTELAKDTRKSAA